MKSIVKISVLCLLTFFVFSACDDDIPSTKKVVNVTIESGVSLIYQLPLGGDEEGARIVHQTENHIVSEIIRNQGISLFEYHYQPKPGYTGNDYVEISLNYSPTGEEKDMYESLLGINITVE